MDLTKPIDVRLLPMRRRHLPAVMKIERDVYPGPWSQGIFVSELNQKLTREYLVAKAGSELAGYAGLMMCMEEAHITTVSVGRAWQGKQIATRMMTQLSFSAIRMGAEAMTLEVAASNRKAQSLYFKFGFHPEGVRKGYYAETNEDALVMWCRDIRTAGFAERLRSVVLGIKGMTRGFEAPCAPPYESTESAQSAQSSWSAQSAQTGRG